MPLLSWFPRTSDDVRASYGYVVRNLLTTVPFAQKNLSRPGCWAYPDMLEVGCRDGPGGKRDSGRTQTYLYSIHECNSRYVTYHNYNVYNIILI